MDLAESAERRLVRRTMQSFIEDRWPLSSVRDLVDGRATVPGTLTAQLAEMGWYALFVDEELGGGSFTDDRMGDAALVAELRGATLQPGPFASVCGAADLLQRGRSDEGRERLGRLVEGEALVVLPCAGDASYAAAPGLTAVEQGGSLRLSGSVLVDAVDALAAVLVVAEVAGRRRPVLVPLDAAGVTCAPLTSTDLTVRFQRVTLTDVLCPAEHVVDVGEEDLDQVLARVTTLSLVESLATLRALLEMSTEYARTRVAFGRPIGSFQALKHLLADISVTVEAAGAVIGAAVRACAAGAPSAPEVASLAKVFTAEAAPRAAQDCLQVHGGIGFAWEHDLHLYLRRIASGTAVFGTADEHRGLVLRIHRENGELA